MEWRLYSYPDKAKPCIIAYPAHVSMYPSDRRNCTQAPEGLPLPIAFFCPASIQMNGLSGMSEVNKNKILKIELMGERAYVFLKLLIGCAKLNMSVLTVYTLQWYINLPISSQYTGDYHLCKLWQFYEPKSDFLY